MTTVDETAAFGALEAARAARVIQSRLQLNPGKPPVAAIILGSGLGGLTGRIAKPSAIPFADIPGFPIATVQGHAGTLVAGSLGGRPVVALAGRFHLYEGHPAALAGFSVRVVHALGARTLIVSNAAGGVRRSFKPGDLMVIDDHINLMGVNPLIGPAQPDEPRFPDMSEPYDRELQGRLRAVAAKLNVPLPEAGVYAGLLGPAYETRAEVRMLARLGVDAVGMSTVPEVIVARALGMRVLGISCITNLACGLAEGLVTHEDVLETTTRVAAQFEGLVEGFVESL